VDILRSSILGFRCLELRILFSITIGPDPLPSTRLCTLTRQWLLRSFFASVLLWQVICRYGPTSPPFSSGQSLVATELLFWAAIGRYGTTLLGSHWSLRNYSSGQSLVAIELLRPRSLLGSHWSLRNHSSGQSSVATELFRLRSLLEINS
jgi:hypothetical protein